jgi:NADPH-dependent ferric siderophore reductase
MSTPGVVRSSPRHGGVVRAVSDLSTRMRRITVHAPTMAGIAVRPAQDVEVFLHGEDGRRVKRRYTIRHARPDQAEIDLDVLLHGAGPGSAWGARARPGDEVQFQGPRGKLQLTSAPWHLLVGDESAIPAIACICDALPADELALAIIEIGAADDEIAMPGSAQVHWVARGDAAPGSPDLLAQALATRELPSADGHGYLMGETRAMVVLRGVLETRGIAHDAIFVKGYWNVGRPDRIAGRSPSA